MAEEKTPRPVEHVIESGSDEDAEFSIILEKPKKKWTSYLWDTLDKISIPASGTR
jgi:hypothetical protein